MYSDYSSASGLILFATIVFFSVGVYLLPGIIASSRDHDQTSAIWALTILLGWTFFGWALAIVWAFTERSTVRCVAPPLPAQAPSVPQKVPAEWRFDPDTGKPLSESTSSHPA